VLADWTAEIPHMFLTNVQLKVVLHTINTDLTRAVQSSYLQKPNKN
jgi:hypothetical protein